MERLIIVNRIDDAPVNSRQWIEPAISKKMTMTMMMVGMTMMMKNMMAMRGISVAVAIMMRVAKTLAMKMMFFVVNRG